MCVPAPYVTRAVTTVIFTQSRAWNGTGGVEATDMPDMTWHSEARGTRGMLRTRTKCTREASGGEVGLPKG